MENRPTDHKLRLAFKINIVLVTILVCETIGFAWLATKSTTGRAAFVFQLSLPDNNPVQKAFPFVDFTEIYPELNSNDIDQLQRECFSLRYVYEPFVEFRPVPVVKRFVSITKDGYRGGGQPWPPRDADFVVFVFGGSTTFGYGLRDEETAVVALESELKKIWPDKTVQCYNFGRGYYYSTQERVLFESLMERGWVPDMAVFIDGLNDFYYANGKPELSETLYAYTTDGVREESAPRLPAKDSIEKVLSRYKNNVRMIKAIGDEYHVQTLFVGQPVPFFKYPRNPQTYPFVRAFAGHELCESGYGQFEEAALKGEFGDSFVWCGDVFSDATKAMYADSIHYSPTGAERLSQMIVASARQLRLLH